jgi:hypothetical protein
MSSLRLRVGVLAGLLVAPACAHAQAVTLRPAIAKPLQAAERDLASRDFAAALKKVAQAAAVPDQTGAETLTIDQVRAAVDASRQDYPAAAADYAALIATGALPAAQVHVMAQAEASSDYQAGNYPGTIATVKAYLAGDPQFTALLLQSYLKLGQCGALAEAVGRIAAPPPETDLQMVAYCDAASKDDAGYLQAMTALVADYPSPAYWSQVLGLEAANPAFSNQLALDFFRLKLAAGVAASAPEFMDMTQAALQAELPNEAASIIDEGYADGVLGRGTDADRQARLKALVAQRQAAANASPAQQAQAAAAAKDEATLFDIGFNEVDGGNAAGLGLMADAIRSGGLPAPGPAELELGIAYREAGQTASARAMWRAVQGGGAPVELAGLWLDLR